MAIESAEAHKVLRGLQKLCLGYPEVNERLSHKTPTFFIRDKKVLCHLWENGHQIGSKDNVVIGLWCPAPPGVQAELVDREPERFFSPPYVGHRGWLGIRLDVDLDWSEVDQILRDAYRLAAPKRLSAELDA